MLPSEGALSKAPLLIVMSDAEPVVVELSCSLYAELDTPTTVA